jgi:hypothetical protein
VALLSDAEAEALLEAELAVLENEGR